MPHSVLSQPFQRPERGSSPAATLLVQAADPLAERTRNKLARIKADKVPPRTILVSSERELNSWIRAELAEEQGLGLRETKLELAEIGRAHV